MQNITQNTVQIVYDHHSDKRPKILFPTRFYLIPYNV